MPFAGAGRAPGPQGSRRRHRHPIYVLPGWPKLLPALFLIDLTTRLCQLKIIGRPPPGIAHHMISRTYGLELLFKFWIAAVFVGVVLHHEPAVSPLDISRCRRCRHPEHLVMILNHECDGWAG